MSEPTKTDLVREYLSQFSTVEDMKAHKADAIAYVTKKYPEGCARSLVYTVIKKLSKDLSKDVLPEPKEPVIKIPRAEEVEIEPEEEELEEAEEIPELPEEPEAIEPEIIEPEEEAEETAKRLGDIFNRSIERLLNIPISELDLKLISKQEAEDSAFLVLLMFGKYTDFQSSEDMLEATSVLHFSSVGIRAFIQWYKERRAKQAEEKAREQEKQEPRMKEASDETTEPTETEAQTEKPNKETEPHFKKLM